MKTSSSQQAFSLLETLVYVAIFSMLITGFAGLLSALTTTKNKLTAISEVEEQGKGIVSLMADSTRESSSVSSPSAGSSGTSLSLARFSPALTPMVFSLSSGIIYVQEGASTPVALNGGGVTASNLSFSNVTSYGGLPFIQFSFTLTTSKGGRADYGYSKVFTGGAQTRNY